MLSWDVKNNMFFEYLLENVEKYPDKLAVKDSVRMITYRELWEEVKKKQSVAKQKGITGATKVLLAKNNSCDWITDFLALAVLGAKVVMLSADTKEEQMKMIASKLDISIIITEENSDKFFGGICKEDKLNDKFPDKNCEMVYHVTSGSTGEFKVCIRTVGQFVAEGEMFHDKLKITKDDIIICPLPVYHSYAFGAVIISGLMAGSEIVLLEKFTPRNYLRQLVSNQATVSVAVPAMVRLLVNVHLKEKIDLSYMRYLVIGAGTVTEEIFSAFRDKFNLQLSSNYGSSETGGIFTGTGENFPSVGQPMKNVNVQIRTEEGLQVKTGSEGRLWVKAPSVMNCYYGKEDVFDRNGYFFTGDLAKADYKGNIYITGRVKNVVNIGGKKVNPVYIETVIRSCPCVNDVVVIGDKRQTGEEYLGAVITGSHDLTSSQIRSFLEERLESYMLPSILRIVNTIPRNSLGKVKKESILSLLKKHV